MNDTKQSVILGASIFFGFALIAAAIFFSDTTSTVNSAEVITQGSPGREEGEPRRLYGNPDAETTIVEFSDYECPYCSRLHPTLKQVVDESEGSIKWEYRHLPLSIHANAEPAAIAAECVGDLLGNDAFWEYSEVLLANQRSMTTIFLESSATQLGVNPQEYQVCIATEEITDRVNKDVQKALSLGGSGTPFNVIEFADGTTKVASGALPYVNWVQILANN